MPARRPRGRPAFRHGDVYGLPIVTKGWDELPEGYCRAYQGVTCDEQPLGRDFFGGDLAGLTAHLDDLASRGITAIYLNPIFAAPSNHRYDTSDYVTIDPRTWARTPTSMRSSPGRTSDNRVILNGVFNHVSSDSPWFDRYGRYPELGACESAESPYRDSFTFRAPIRAALALRAVGAGRHGHLLRELGWLRQHPGGHRDAGVRAAHHGRGRDRAPLAPARHRRLAPGRRQRAVTRGSCGQFVPPRAPRTPTRSSSPRSGTTLVAAPRRPGGLRPWTTASDAL